MGVSTCAFYSIVNKAKLAVVEYCVTFPHMMHVSLKFFNPQHHNISMHILHNVLYLFPKVLRRRICLTIKSFLSWWSFLIFSWLLSVIQGWSCKEKLDASHSWGLKGWNIELRIILYIIYEIEILGYLLLAFDQRSIWDNNVFWFKAQSSGWGEKYFFPLTRCRRNFLGLK